MKYEVYFRNYHTMIMKISLNTKHSPGCRGELVKKEKVILSDF